mgnify:FL=1
MHRIGVFDSGIGGLTVLRQLRRAFPQLDMVYLGDTARVPYGGRSVETITHYAEDDVRFLLRKDVEAIVIACGTVSSNSLDALREKFDLPIYGVIESAARLAASMTKTRSVGVIGTQATVKSGAYETHIRAIDPGVHVVSRACPLFVPLVENGIAPDDIVAALHDLTGRVEASFILDRLDYMKKGGRCSAVTLLGANLLKLRPCIEVRDGKMGVGKKYRGSFDKCVCEYITDKIGNRSDLELRRVFITHSGVSEESVQKAVETVQKLQPFEEICVTRAGCTVSSHCGPGTLGVLYIRKADQ